MKGVESPPFREVENVNSIKFIISNIFTKTGFTDGEVNTGTLSIIVNYLR